MDETEKLLKEGATNPKPPVGVGTDSVNLYRYDEEGNIIENRNFGGSGLWKSQHPYESDPEKARVGDYYYDQSGNLQVVPNSPTDIYNKWKITDDTSLYSKPTRQDVTNLMLSPIAETAGASGAGAIIGAIKGGAAAAASGAAIPLATLLPIAAVMTVNQEGRIESAYKDALKQWQESQDKANWKLAGELKVEDDGKMYFTPDASKAIKMNAAFSGTEIQKAFQKETDVKFGNDGRLKIDVNPIYANTDDYAERIDIIKKAYKGLTKDSEGLDDILTEIKDYLEKGNNQFKFKEQSMFSYKRQIPDAADSDIEDAYQNEIGAYISESDGADYKVKMYRDGEIKETTAKDVLEEFYKKDLGKRSDYVLDLYNKMEDPNISAKDKVYILSELKLLEAADGNDNTYDNGAKNNKGETIKTKNKYFGMLDQESIISALNNWNLVGGISVTEVINAVDKITPWNMHISDQAGLQEDPAAASAARVISTATSAFTAYLAMQAIEYKLVRPIASKIGSYVTSSTDSFLERVAANGGKLSNLIGKAQLLGGGLEYSAEAGNLIAKWVEGARVAAGPLVKTLGWSMGELLINATSDLVFDVGKVAVKNLSGDETPWDDFAQDFGTDLVMDVIIQYGPAGLSQARSYLDNAKVEKVFAPYKENLSLAMSKFDAADIEYTAAKEAIADMRKGTKKYETAQKDLKAKKKAYESTKKEYEEIREAASKAVKEAMPTASEELGAAFAGKLATMEKNDIVMWLRKKFTDENAALSTLAQQAYNKTNDVYLYAAAVNKFQTIQAGINEVAVKMNYMDSYAKGTAKSYQNFVNAIAAAAPGAKFSKTQIEYMVAKSEYEVWSANVSEEGDLAKISEKYQPYIDKVQGEERVQLDDLLEKTKDYLKKVGESYVNSGAATKKQMQDIVEASLGDGYIPLWGKGDKNTNRIGLFEAPLTMKVGRKFDPSEGKYAVENMQNPIESAAAYTNAIMNNIARNEMAAMLKEIASIEGIDVQLSEAVSSTKASEFDDIIQETLVRYTNQRKDLIGVSISADKYQNGLNRLLAKPDNSKAIKEIDALMPKQKQLQKLVSLNNVEKDPIKKANRLVKIANLDAKIKAEKAQIRADIDTRVRAAGEYFNKKYGQYGITVDVENTLTSAKYTDPIDSHLNSISEEGLIKLKGDIENTINRIAPYLPLKKVQTKELESAVKALRIHVNNRIKKENPDISKADRVKKVNKATADFKAILNGDFKEEVVAPEGYKINYSVGNKDASFYIKGDLAKEVAAEMNSKNIIDRRKVYIFFKEAANIKRLLTTGIDPTRVLPNLVRDTLRNGIMSGGTDYWFFDNSPFGFQQMFTKMARAMGDSDEQIAQALRTMSASQEIASGSTFNEALSGRKTNRIKRLVESSDAVGKNRGTKFVWNLAHDKRGLLEAPMNFVEGLTRNRAASSAFMRAYTRGGVGLDFETRLNNAYEAGINAGRENTVNFTRRGTFIKEISAFVPYLSQRFSSIESTKIAFLKDPVGVSTRLMMFGAAYMIELSRVLADEESRKNYYNLSEYDRENNIILSMNGDLVTIPLDETLAALIYPWRRGIEVMHNVDPQNFFMIMVNSFLELSPFDLSGFTEDDSFNFGRGLEKLGAQVLPTLAQAGYSQLTGRNMYYGSSVAVTKDDLLQYGNYTPTAGDYTAASKNSQVLRGIADALGIEQWRLQQVIADLGGNVGQYTVNWLDKITGAPEDAQGGKDFMDATFKSFTGMDSTQVQYAFNDGIARLEEDKLKVKAKLDSINEKISLASGEKLAELQDQYKKVKQDFAMKVGNFVDKYINAYEIAGGLTKAQANKIWYLFNFSDDDTMTMDKSVESYYRDQAQKQASKEATQYASSVLDKYFDQTKNVYKGDDGKFHYYSPYGEQAFFNTIQGKGLEYQIALRNILEDSDSNLSSLKSQVYNAREKAANAKNWDEYDRLGLAFDEKILAKIAPYIESVGSKNALSDSKVLDYLEEWFFVPTSYMKTKYGKNLSLAHNASKQRAFVRPYIKQLFGLSTAYTESNYVERPDRLVGGQ